MDRLSQISEYYQIYAKRLGKNKLNAEEFQPLVLNIAYLEIAIAKRQNKSYNTEYLFIEYTKAALIAIPEYEKEVNDPRYSTMYFGFAATAEWDGLWNFLCEYFESKLGIQIDNNQKRKTLRFDSTNHNRYENGKLIISSNALRKISVNISEDMKNAQFNISETLSNKEANLISAEGKKYVYIGTDPDYLFEFTLDSYNNIELFSITRTDKNLKIDYLE